MEMLDRIMETTLWLEVLEVSWESLEMGSCWNMVMVSKCILMAARTRMGFGLVSHAENPALVTKQCGQLNEEATVFQAEIYTLKEVAAWIFNLRGCPITLYTDPREAFKSIANPIY